MFRNEKGLKWMIWKEPYHFLQKLSFILVQDRINSAWIIKDFYFKILHAHYTCNKYVYLLSFLSVTDSTTRTPPYNSSHCPTWGKRSISCLFLHSARGLPQLAHTCSPDDSANSASSLDLCLDLGLYLGMSTVAFSAMSSTRAQTSSTSSMYLSQNLCCSLTETWDANLNLLARAPKKAPSL